MASHLPPTGSVWAISDTANHGVTIARGLLEAATSDDINPVALMCCESFGSLLPVSPETRLKVEQLARRNHTSHVLNFVKAQIGYKRDDSVDQLSRSDSGIRFLCLVATFCTLNHYDAADRLDSILQATQKSSQIRPTIKQLQIMVSAVGKKLALSDFAASIAGFEILLRSKFAEPDLTYYFDIAQVPNKSSLERLIIALNELCRFGEDSPSHSLNIRLRSCHAAWTSAFIKWLLGVPPTIRTSQKTLLDSKRSIVTLTILQEESASNSRKRAFDKSEEGLEIVAARKTHSLREIFFHEEPHEKRWAWQGLVDARTWFKYQFSAFSNRFRDIHTPGPLRSAVGQALYFIICILPDQLALCSDFQALKISLVKGNGIPTDLLHETVPRPFLSKAIRLQVAKDLLGDEIELVEEFQGVRSILSPENLATRFRRSCRQCNNPQNMVLGGTIPCDVHDFLDYIGEIGATVLTMTLFGEQVNNYPMITVGRRFDNNRFHSRLSSAKRRHVGSWKSNWRMLVTTGWQDLLTGKCSILSCQPTAIFRHAARLLGHTYPSDRVIVSSGLDQVLYPAFFETRGILSDGYMQLCAFPGYLRRDEMSFDFLIDIWNDETHVQDESDLEIESSDGDDYDELGPSEHKETDSAENLQGDLDLDTEIATSEHGDKEFDIATSDTSQVAHQTVVQIASELQDGTNGEGVSIDDAQIGNISMAPDITASSKTATLDTKFSARLQKSTRMANQMTWKISVRESVLDGELYLDDTSEPIIAWALLEQLGFCAFTPPCRHLASRCAGAVAERFILGSLPITLRSPEWPKTMYDVGRDFCAQLGGLERQNYFPLTVLHHKGCIGCALQLCLDLNSNIVIS